MAGDPQLTIYNRALALIGARAGVASVSDTISTEGQVINRHWPSVFDAALEMHDWRFARSRVLLVGSTSILLGFPYTYTTPADCLVFRGILNQFGSWGTYPIVPFARETMEGGFDVVGTVLPSSSSGPIAVYTRSVTDPTQTSFKFTDGLALLLASYIAFEITESAQLGPGLAQAAQNQLENAWREDMQQLRVETRTQFKADWQAARG